MSEFKHSIVLFTGKDGLPLEFNVRNTNEKAHLKALIEYGGGFCTQNENSVHLISPGTKVLNVDSGKKLVSSTYIHDCVKQNYLLNVNEYVYTISEAQTSDISDEDSERLLAPCQSTCKSPIKNIPVVNMDISPIKKPNISNETTPSNLTLPSSSGPPICTSSESFVEGSQEASSYRITSHVYYGNVGKPANEKIKTSEGLKENSEDFNPSQSLVYPSKPKDLLIDSVKNTLNLHSPSKQAASGNSLNHNSPAKNIINASPVLPFSPQKLTKEKVYYSPKKQVEISPIKRADAKKVQNYINQLAELPTRNPSQELAENVHMEEDFQENTIGDGEISIDVEDISQPGNQFVPSASPLKSTDRPFENPQPDQTKKAHNVSAIETVVSSSQPLDELDNFDNMLLSKAHHKSPSEGEESISQTCTVSSSADAQVSSKPNSAENNTPSFQGASPDNLPDSPNLSYSQTNEEEYMKNLEIEVQAILEKPPPRSIQDKITLVKYVCCVRKLTPRTVLESLSSKSDSLDL